MDDRCVESGSAGLERGAYQRLGQESGEGTTNTVEGTGKLLNDGISTTVVPFTSSATQKTPTYKPLDSIALQHDTTQHDASRGCTCQQTLSYSDERAGTNRSEILGCDNIAFFDLSITTPSFARLSNVHRPVTSCTIQLSSVQTQDQRSVRRLADGGKSRSEESVGHGLITRASSSRSRQLRWKSSFWIRKIHASRCLIHMVDRCTKSARTAFEVRFEHPVRASLVYTSQSSTITASIRSTNSPRKHRLLPTYRLARDLASALLTSKLSVIAISLLTELLETSRTCLLGCQSPEL
nr:hypothetical protein CFP56_59718 [Quercus suber]